MSLNFLGSIVAWSRKYACVRVVVRFTSLGGHTYDPLTKGVTIVMPLYCDPLVRGSLCRWSCTCNPRKNREFIIDNLLVRLPNDDVSPIEDVICRRPTVRR